MENIVWTHPFHQQNKPFCPPLFLNFFRPSDSPLSIRPNPFFTYYILFIPTLSYNITQKCAILCGRIKWTRENGLYRPVFSRSCFSHFIPAAFPRPVDFFAFLNTIPPLSSLCMFVCDIDTFAWLNWEEFVCVCVCEVRGKKGNILLFSYRERGTFF